MQYSFANNKSLIINHEWTRMDTKVHDESTEYTEETECLADVCHRSEKFGDNMLF